MRFVEDDFDLDIYKEKFYREHPLRTEISPREAFFDIAMFASSAVITYFLYKAVCLLF
ncbi:hypothetical protein AGMMS49975_09400 [Clostridia bacterium]|nr:hypothetical protein AGMMS49975_09400 [Clostridia bacterium]